MERVLAAGMYRRITSLHGKLVIALIIAAAIPFLVGLVFFETVGYSRMLEERAKLHYMEAKSMASSIQMEATSEGEKLRTWFESEPQLIQYALEKSDEADARPLVEVSEEVQHLDAIWPSLPNNDPKVTSLLDNPASKSLAKYQGLHPEVGEILMTDKLGRLIAATGRSSDIHQADELWWQKGAALIAEGHWMDTVYYDESSGFFSIGVVRALHHEGTMVGVVKMALKVESLVPRFVVYGEGSKSKWALVLRSGRILLHSDRGLESRAEGLSYETLVKMHSSDEGWMTGEDTEGHPRLVGYDALDMGRAEPNAYVVFYSLRSDLLDPLWASFMAMAVAGSLLLILFMLVGFHMIQRKVLKPIALLSDAARSLSVLATVRRNTPNKQDLIRAQHELVEEELLKVQQIRTGDQIEVLASDLALMMSRVLNYQAESESQSPDERRED